MDVNYQARKALDEEIAQLFEQIRCLRSRRNTLAPVYVLPPDVMRIVFTYAHFDAAGNLTALRLSWVSRGWRELALSTRHLWATITSTNLGWIQAGILRAGNVDLRINLSITKPPQDPRFLTSLIESLPRTQQLSIFADDNHRVEFITPAVRSPSFSRLESVYLGGVSIPAEFFPGILPALEVIYLRECEIDWDRLPLMPRLTSLAVDNPCQLIEVTKLVQFLHGTPNIQRISFSKALLNPDSVSPGIRSHRLQLGHLDGIYFNKVWSDAAAELFRSVQIPNTAKGRFDLYANLAGDPFSIIDSFVDCRSALISSPSLVIYTLNGIQKIALNGAYYYLRFSFPGILPIINAVRRCVSFSSLETVTLDGHMHDNTDPAEFNQVFRSFTSVPSLLLGGGFTTLFLLSIIHQNEGFSRRSSSTPSLVGDAGSPVLLVFHGLKMLTLGEGLLSVEEEPDLKPLAEWLRYQKNEGVELTRLSISPVDPPGDVKSVLEGLVDEVVWNS
ncbi:hypothetical protein BDN72DRAFT_302037 [Pluteus cervinus]|uniref:Uncharacterized protein n=1 Tax=Pluteus cervinus TaxID=181527 RepID=A0ACD3B6K0_9AGAR|nr:hypothetical protein BDN72DRAFT_302037 [Pluteus cervinus]